MGNSRDPETAEAHNEEAPRSPSRWRIPPRTPIHFRVANSVTKTDGALVTFGLRVGEDVIEMPLTPAQAASLGMQLISNAETARTMMALFDVLMDDGQPEEDKMPLGTVKRLLKSMSSARARYEMEEYQMEERLHARPQEQTEEKP